VKNVIITGASGNLGKAVTSLFLERGYTVLATVTNEASKKDLPLHDNLHAITANLADESEAAQFVQQAIARHTGIDAALLLVGGFTMGSLKNSPGDVVKQQLALNFDTAYYVARPLFEHMLEQGTGRLVFIGARPALQPADGKNAVAYALSKSLLFTLAELLNAEAKGTNVTATVVVPSTLDTPANRENMPDADPSNWVQPAALAEVLEFVVSEKGSPLRETVLKVYNKA
jgi:NAD(P)-dependent dehydrogenase (short-subunit alcohol dehydrogenase family)